MWVGPSVCIYFSAILAICEVLYHIVWVKEVPFEVTQANFQRIFPEISKNQKIFESSKGQQYAVLGQRTSLKCLSMLSECSSFILAPSVFLVACSDSIRHYVPPSVRP